MRVLYISYFYPPLGGPAALRAVKTVKYLTEEGITCDVITAGEPEYLYRDESLLAECRAGRVFRTASLDPMSLLKKSGLSRGNELSGLYLKTPESLKLRLRRLYPIDDKIGWVPFLLKAGHQALSSADYDLIYASLGPFSSALGAHRLARLSGLPLVLDLRDYWNLLSDYDLQGHGLKRWFSLHWERKVDREAKLIVSATRGIGEDAAEAFGPELRAKLLTVYNGWDEADFNALPAVESEGGFTFAYFGNLYARRSLKHFYRALKRLRDEGSLPLKARVLLYGNFFREAQAEIAESGIADMIGIVPQLPHAEALARMRAADVLLLTINSSSPRGTLTSKLFEYLRSQRPILGMVPAHNEAAVLLRECGHSHICAMESQDSIYLCLKDLLAGSGAAFTVPWALERGNQVRRLAEKLRELFPPSG